MPKPQTYENHLMFDPMYHFVIAPLAMLNLLLAFVFWNSFDRQHPHVAFVWILTGILLLLISAKLRLYALRLQDRLIGVEERLRLTALLPSSEHPVISRLSLRQLIALRFASDEELPSLAHRSLHESLDPKQIKRAIQNWRPDHHRV